MKKFYKSLKERAIIIFEKKKILLINKELEQYACQEIFIVC